MLNALEIKVAVIDDDENDFFIISDYIKEIQGARFTIDWYANYNNTIDSLREKTYDIYFIDYRLGGKTGLELLQDASLIEKDTPVVILTGKGNKNIAIATMQSGATDYLIKSELSAEKLERCIRYSLERAAHTRELRDREHKYRNLFESSKDAVFISNEDLVFLEVNTAGMALFGFTLEEMQSYRFSDFIVDPIQQELVTTAIGDGRSVKDLEVALVNRDGISRNCLFSMSFQQARGSGMLVNGIVHDITDLKNAEKANVMAQKLAANERLMRLLAHEIRNPLNNINLSVENFTFPASADENQQFLLDIIQRNCGRINQIITELLNLTRKEDLQFQKYDLADILNESIEMTADRIKLQKIRLVKEIPENDFELVADKAKLKIAFANIIINAIEATNENLGELLVSLSGSPQNHIVSIKDNGVGIADDILGKLAEPFFTLKKNGMGLGLAASYSILQSHGASIQVHSKVNEGTNFVIQFCRT